MNAFLSLIKIRRENRGTLTLPVGASKKPTGPPRRGTLRIASVKTALTSWPERTSSTLSPGQPASGLIRTVSSYGASSVIASTLTILATFLRAPAGATTCRCG